MKRSYLVLHLSTAALALFLCVGTATFLGPCIHEDGSAGPCRDAGTASVLLSGTLAVLALLPLLLAIRRAPLLSVVPDAAAAVLSVVLFLVPGVLCRLCMMDTMRCLSVMQPAVRILSAVLFVLFLSSVISILRRRRTA